MSPVPFAPQKVARCTNRDENSLSLPPWSPASRNRKAVWTEIRKWTFSHSARALDVARLLSGAWNYFVSDSKFVWMFLVNRNKTFQRHLEISDKRVFCLNERKYI